MDSSEEFTVMTPAKERELMELTDSVEDRSQDYFYQAMEATNEQEQAQLLTQSLDLDPDNVDSNLVRVHLTELSIEDEVEELKRITEVAEGKLGATVFENERGKFWSNPRTRPYMRACGEYADVLFAIGRTPWAIKEWEKMVELNPSDNQGIRFRLLVAYIECENYRKAGEILELHQSEIGSQPVMAWANVIHEYETAGERKAVATLDQAREQNKFVSAYVTGMKKVPVHVPESYQLGSKEQAEYFAADIVSMFSFHKEARKWVMKQIKKGG